METKVIKSSECFWRAQRLHIAAKLKLAAAAAAGAELTRIHLNQQTDSCAALLVARPVGRMLIQRPIQINDSEARDFLRNFH